MSYQIIECPNCPKKETKRGPIGIRMTELESNYSGCGVDIYTCPECNKLFQVSYKVDEITEINYGK